MEKSVMKTKCSFIQVISPAVAIPKVHLPLYFFHTDELRAIKVNSPAFASKQIISLIAHRVVYLYYYDIMSSMLTIPQGMQLSFVRLNSMSNK